jgi:3-oxoacyl-[acyl-carrier-protein] synthase II
VIAITRWAAHVPGEDTGALFGAASGEVACAADACSERLGRKGLLYKDEATRLALCAVHGLLDLPRGTARQQTSADPRVAVVACSNLGNVAAVCDMARRVREGTRKDVSPLEAPTASSNVIASQVALWFGFAGPNLMVCSGASASVDAVELGATLLRGGRADRVIIVGVEPSDALARAIHARSARRGELRAGAAALLLERDPPGPQAWIGPARAGSQPPNDAGATWVFGPSAGWCGQPQVDLYGGVGVLQLAAAAARIRSAAPVRECSALVVCGDEEDGFGSMQLWSRAERCTR